MRAFFNWLLSRNTVAVSPSTTVTVSPVAEPAGDNAKPVLPEKAASLEKIPVAQVPKEAWVESVAAGSALAAAQPTDQSEAVDRVTVVSDKGSEKTEAAARVKLVANETEPKDLMMVSVSRSSIHDSHGLTPLPTMKIVVRYGLLNTATFDPSPLADSSGAGSTKSTSLVRKETDLMRACNRVLIEKIFSEESFKNRFYLLKEIKPISNYKFTENDMRTRLLQLCEVYKGEKDHFQLIHCQPTGGSPSFLENCLALQLVRSSPEISAILFAGSGESKSAHEDWYSFRFDGRAFLLSAEDYDQLVGQYITGEKEADEFLRDVSANVFKDKHCIENSNPLPGMAMY